MTSEQRLKHLISDLDGAARREIASAASEGRFDELPSLVPLAKDIAALAERWHLGPTNELPATPIEEDSTSPPVEAQVTPKGSKAADRVKKTGYPRFLREKRDLVKLGWSPRQKGPYEHRVPKTAVDDVAAAVAARGKSGHRFTMDEIISALGDAKGAAPIPSYQAYAAISWLKWAGLVMQHGRQGYTVIRPQTFASAIEAGWQSLPQR
jgi:hypothetical protein